MNPNQVRAVTCWTTKSGKRRHIKLFKVWNNLIQRCRNYRNKDYKWYGEKGVRVCKQWLQFDGFREWAVASGFRKGVTIERIDRDGDYCPENCTWIPQAQQLRNHGRARLITFDGETKCISEWARHFGINKHTLRYRIDRTSADTALTALKTHCGDDDG